MLPDANELIVIKNDVFGVDVYAPAAKRVLSPRYDVLPDANELMVMKNDVFGLDVYAPVAK